MYHKDKAYGEMAFFPSICQLKTFRKQIEKWHFALQFCQIENFSKQMDNNWHFPYNFDYWKLFQTNG